VSATQAVLLAVAAAMLVYLGVAMFKPEWF
jgi:K+-transporting ATPase KdpF subunit